MTRPVADILAEAARNDWPTSSIGAMAKHHLCAGLTRSEPSVLGSKAGEGGPPEGCGLSLRQGPHPTYLESSAAKGPSNADREGTGDTASGCGTEGPAG